MHKFETRLLLLFLLRTYNIVYNLLIGSNDALCCKNRLSNTTVEIDSFAINNNKTSNTIIDWFTATA